MGYEKLIDNMTHSYSRLSCYEECPYEYYLTYIERDPDRLKQNNFHAMNGSAMHNVFAEILKHEIPIEKGVDRYYELFSEIDEYTSEKVMDTTYAKCVEYLAKLEYLPERYVVMNVESKYIFKVGKYKFIGFVDLLLEDRETGELILVDHKSSKHFMKKDGITPLKNMEDQLNSYKKQMYLYCKGIKDTFGLQVNKIVWHHFKDNGVLTVIPFNETEYQETLKWAVDLIEKIKQDEEFQSNPSFIRCRDLCPYRNSCEYLEGDDE